MIELILFYFYASISLYSSLMVISVKNPVHSVLFLILSFISVSCLLFLLRVEFLSLLFIIVYVGAIGVLFLFVVMMLDIKIKEYKLNKFDYFPFVGFLLIPLIYLFLDFFDSLVSKWVPYNMFLEQPKSSLELKPYKFIGERYETCSVIDLKENNDIVLKDNYSVLFNFYTLQQLKLNTINSEYKRIMPTVQEIDEITNKVAYYSSCSEKMPDIYDLSDFNNCLINLDRKLSNFLSIIAWNTMFTENHLKELPLDAFFVPLVVKKFFNVTDFNLPMNQYYKLTPIFYVTGSVIADTIFNLFGYKNLENWYNTIDYISDIRSFGQIFYTYHFAQFVLVGLILLVALMGSIVLTITFNKTKSTQNINRQIVKNYNNAVFFVKK